MHVSCIYYVFFICFLFLFSFVFSAFFFFVFFIASFFLRLSQNTFKPQSAVPYGHRALSACSCPGIYLHHSGQPVKHRMLCRRKCSTYITRAVTANNFSLVHDCHPVCHWKQLFKSVFRNYDCSAKFTVDAVKCPHKLRCCYGIKLGRRLI